MKRIWKALPALLLAVLVLTGTAAAEEGASMAAGFRQDGQFYGFAQTPRWPEELRLLSGGLSVPVKTQPQRLSESGLPVSYLLLVDCSTSMESLWGRVRSFTSALAEADGTAARFSLATFGEKFSVVWDGADQEGDIVSAMSGIACSAERTELSQGILDAVDYLSGQPRRAGELVNLVVITDGVPKYSTGPSLEEVAETLEEDSSILVHTCGLSTGSSESAQALESLETLGRGLHMSVKGSGAKSRGESLAEHVNDLCVIRFAWGEQNQGDVDVFLLYGDEEEEELPVDMDKAPLLGTVSEPELPDEAGEGSPEAPGGTEDPEEPEDPVPPEGPDTPDTSDGEGGDTQEADPPAGPAGPEGSEDTDGTGDTDGSKDTDDSKDTDGSEDTDSDADPGPDKPGIHWAVWVAAGALCAALIVLIAVLLLRRRKRPAADRKGIYMRMEVISGAYAGPGELYLVDELIIGRGGKCDIPWKDRDLAPRSARIFLRDNMICIEDLGSPQGTALGGMRLHSPNRLRSGDEISIGPVRFRLKF